MKTRIPLFPPLTVRLSFPLPPFPSPPSSMIIIADEKKTRPSIQQGIQHHLLPRHAHHLVQPLPRAVGSVYGVEVARFVAWRRGRWRGWGWGWRRGRGLVGRTGAGRRWTRVWRRSSSPSSLYQTRPRPHPRPRSHPRPHPATATATAPNPSRSRYMVEPRFLDWSRPRRIWRLAR